MLTTGTVWPTYLGDWSISIMDPVKGTGTWCELKTHVCTVDEPNARALRKQRLLRIEPELTLSSPGVLPWIDPFPGVRPGGFTPPFRADTYGFKQRERDLGSFWQRAMMAVSKFLGLIQGAASFGCLSNQGTLSARIRVFQ